MAFQSMLPTRPISGPDVDAMKVPAVPCTGANSIMAGAISNAPEAKLIFRIVCTDPFKNVVGVIGPITLVASKKADWGAFYLSRDLDGKEPSYHCEGVDLSFIKIDELDPPTAKWTLGAASK